MGKLLFQMTAAFAEFERTMIRQRVNAGLSTIRAKITPEGRFTSKAAIVRSRLGRPNQRRSPARLEQAKGIGIGRVARLTGTGTEHKLKRKMAARRVSWLVLERKLGRLQRSRTSAMLRSCGSTITNCSCAMTKRKPRNFGTWSRRSGANS